MKSLSRRENKNPVRQENDKIDTIRHGSASSFGSMSRAFLSEDEFRIGPHLTFWRFDLVYIDVGDGCLRRNVLVTFLRRW